MAALEIVAFDEAVGGFTAPQSGDTYLMPRAAAMAAGVTFGWSTDLFLARDAANTLAIRNSTNAQTFNVYNTYTDASNYERVAVKFASNVAKLVFEKAGTGTVRTLEIQSGYDGPLVHSGSNVWEVANTSSSFPAIRFASGTGVVVGSGLQLGFNSSTYTNSGGIDTGLARAAAGVVKVTNGSTGGGAVELQEQTAPSAPATNNVRIYAEDNGSGKTRLMALFPTGAAQQIAIEP